MSIFTVIRRAAVAPLCCAIVVCALTAVAAADARPPALKAAAQPAQQYITTASGVTPLQSLAPQHQAESYYASYGDVEQLPLTRAEATGGMPAWMLGVLIVAGLAALVPVVTGARLVRRRRLAAAPA